MTGSALWQRTSPLVLASTSPTRRNLLAAAGIPVEADAPGVDERMVEAEASRAGLPAERLATRLARAKADAVAARYPGRLVLAADQVLLLQGSALHKPADRAQARRHLLALAGQAHHLVSAFALVTPDGVIEGEDRATLTVRPFSDAFLDVYLDAMGDRVTQSVGGYQVEGAGIHLFERIDGDHSTIMGLPMIPVLSALRSVGAILT
jgi:septum formation protein